MAEISADTTVELAQASFTKTRVRYDGQIELASANLFSNPGLQDFDSEGNPENVALGAPEDPVGWGVLISKLDTPKKGVSHQDTGPIPLAQDFFYQRSDLIDGPPPQDASKRAKIAAPTGFTVRLEGRENTQLVGGWRGMTYGWIMGKGKKAGNPFVALSPFLTNSSPRSAIQITGGQSIVVSFDGITPPAHAVGMFVASTRAQTSEANAINPNTTLYIQRKWDIRQGMPPDWEFDGPMRTTQIAPNTGSGEGPSNAENRTYRGGTARWPRVQWKKRRTHTKTSGFQTKLNWQFLTETGEWSRPQTETSLVSTTNFADKKRMGVFFRPQKHPANARMWRPLYYNMQSEIWYGLPARGINEWAVIHYTNVEKYPEGKKPEAIEYNRANREPDGTGIPGPDSALELTQGADSDQLDAGRYAIRTVFYDEDGNETAPSAPVVKTVALGESLRISRPRIGNILYNSDAHEWSVTTADSANSIYQRARGWEHMITRDGLSTNVIDYGFQMRNTFYIRDIGSTGNTTVAKSAWSDVPDDLSVAVPYSVRVLSQFIGRTTPVDNQSGTFHVWIETRPRPDISQPTAPVGADFPGGTIPTNTLWEDTKANTGAGRAGMGGTSPADDISIVRKWNGSAWILEAPTVQNANYETTQNSGNTGDAIVEHRIKLLPNSVGANPDVALPSQPDSKGTVVMPAFAQSAGKGQVRVVYSTRGGTAHNIPNLRVHFLGKLAGESYPRVFPSEDDTDAPEVEIPREIDSGNVLADPTKRVFEYKKHGICRLSRVPASERHSQLSSSIYDAMRFVEYWGAYNTPAAEEHGLIGYAQPAQENTEYTVSCYLEHRGVTVQTSVLAVGCFDARGTQLSGPFYLKTGVLGDTAVGGVRQSRTFTTPANTAYIKIYKGGFSDGFWRVGGFQLRAAASAGTYTFGNDLSGTRTFTFDTGAGIDEGSHLEFLGEVAEWLSGGAVFTANAPASDEYDATQPDTTVTVEMKSSEVADNWAGLTWHTDFEDVPKHRYWQIRVTLTAEANLGTPGAEGTLTESTASPLVDSVGLELVRPYAQLLGPDGKEYDKPVQVVNFPVPTPERQREMFLSDNNTPRFGLRGKELHYADGFGLETYSDAAVRAANWSAIREDGQHIVEDYYSNRSFLVWLENSPRWAVDREIYKEQDPYYIHRADGLTAVVLEQEALTGEPIFYDE